jgi:hypothetical protein
MIFCTKYKHFSFFPMLFKANMRRLTSYAEALIEEYATHYRTDQASVTLAKYKHAPLVPLGENKNN